MESVHKLGAELKAELPGGPVSYRTFSILSDGVFKHGKRYPLQVELDR